MVLNKHDVTTYSYLYDKPDKSQIVYEIYERALRDADLTFKLTFNVNDVVVVDFMSFSRSRMVSGKKRNLKTHLHKWKIFYKIISSHNSAKFIIFTGLLLFPVTYH